MAREFKIDLKNDFTEEEAAAIRPDVEVHKKDSQIVAMYEAGCAPGEIANKLKVSTRTIYAVLKAKGIEKRIHSSFTHKRLAQLDEDTKEAIVKSYLSDKYKVSELLAIFNLNKNVLYTVLDEAGVPRRSQPKHQNIEVHQDGDELRVVFTKHAQQAFKKLTVSYEV